MATNAHKATSTFFDNNLAAIGVEDENLVLAWAKDVETGSPIYILQLGKDRQGAKSNCICMGCEEPLQAVNAAKEVGTYKKRPHFRHHVGVQTDSCAVLTARALALQQLKELGVIELPRRRRSANAVGLSGTDYQAWVESPIERSFVRHFSFVDSMRGVVTLEDGREVDVVLVGSVAEAEAADTSQVLRPEIRIVVEGAEFSGLDPAQLQEALRMRIKEGFWCSHWKDVELELQAAEEAKRKKKGALDWLDGGVQFPEGTTDAEKRETILHALAKQILEREKRMRVPALEIDSDLPMVKGFSEPAPQVLLPDKDVIFSGVELEKKVGGIRPDVIATIDDLDDIGYPKLAIEITVTNTMDTDRISKIQSAGLPTIEINLSRLGGVLTEEIFRDILIQSVLMKSWIFHPDTLPKINNINSKNIQGDASFYADIFLREMRSYGLADASGKFHTPEYDVIKNNVKRLAYKLSEFGYQEATDSHIICPDGLINRIQSIKMNSAIGYKYNTSWQVINAILQDKGWSRRFHTIYLMAIKKWNPTIDLKQREKVENWRSSVSSSLMQGDDIYRREPIYDRLLSLLFPELAQGIGKPLPTRAVSVASTPAIQNAIEIAPKPIGQAGNRHFSQPTFRSFGSVSRDPDWHRLTDRDTLKGSEYEEWKRRNPEAAAAWENAQKNKPAY